MAGKKGRIASLKLDNQAGTLTDLSRKGAKISTNFTTEILDATTFQPPGGAKEKMVGVSDGKISFEGNADSVVATHLLAIRGQSEPTGGTAGEGFDFEIGPEGTATGTRKLSGKCFLASYAEETDVNGINKFTAELELHGDVTVGAHS